RLAALSALESRADAVDAAAVRQALRDPSDDVRAGAVRLAAARSEHDVPEVFAMVAERQWPATQQAALEALPPSGARTGLGADALGAVRGGAAGMDPGPTAAERGGFAALATAVGTDRLASVMEAMDGRRIGAARLLLQEDSQESLRALASYARDPEP